ncbi:type III-B CRISPR module-associated protein Cmr5 [Ureibacillus terrenus]|jgi:CRISPR-associated protein Cmr5|uniref:CRISPR type III-B/RAMP module-associated protein Cmr5 n=2 Tax=Ureibacillus TaxID=160795 RepID=A0A540UWX7_9BACL|nr:type III-B CRISPR module-associated protein Cmr5 [Ureibacillus terrenus]
MMSNRPISTIEGGRASFAFSEVKKFVETHREHAKDYRSYVKKMPAMIQVNGLGQTLAFYYSKKNKKAYYEIYQTITSWLKKEFPQFFTKEQTLVEVVINLDSSDYRMFTIEVMALLNWMRKFVDGMVEVKEGES